MDLAAGMTLRAHEYEKSTTSLSNSHLVALHEVVQSVARQTDTRATLAVVAENVRLLTGATRAAVALLDPTRTLLDFVAVAGPDADQMLGQKVRVEDSLAGQTALTGEIYLAHHPASSRPLLASLDPGMTLDWGVRAAAVVPIYVAGHPAGVLAAINREDDEAFGGDDLLRLQVLANAAALAITVSDLREEAAEKQRERDILYEAARTTSSSLNVQEVLGSVLATVAGSMEMTVGAVFLLNDEHTRLYIGADQGLSAEDQDRQLAADTGLAAQMLASGLPVRVTDALQADLTDDLLLPEMRSLLAAPMIARSASEGLIVVGSRQSEAYSAEDANLLLTVASQAAVALENAWLYENATRRAEEATAIYELSQAVGATLQLDRVLHFVADSVLGLLQVDKFALFLYDPRAGALEIKIARNISPEALETMRPRPGEGIAGWVLEFETPTAVQDVAADHRNRSCPIDTEGVISLVSVPLQAGDQVIGVLHAMSSRRRLFTVGEMELLYTIANQVGAAIGNAQMYEEARQNAEQIRKYVRRFARVLGSSLDTKQMGQFIADVAAEMMQADRSVLLTRDSQACLAPRAAANFKAALSAPGETTAGETPAAWVAQRGRSLSMENLVSEPRFTPAPYAARERVSGYLGVPLKLGKEVLGVLEVYTREPRRFTTAEVRLLLTFASQASVGLQNALLVEQANRRIADLRAIGAISKRLNEQSPDDEFWREMLQILAEATLADQGMLSLFTDPPREVIYGGGSPALSALVSEVRERQEAALKTAPGAAASEDSYVGAPLPGPSAPLGAIVLGRGAPASFDSFDLQLLATAANLLAVRLH